MADLPDAVTAGQAVKPFGVIHGELTEVARVLSDTDENQTVVCAWLALTCGPSLAWDYWPSEDVSSDVLRLPASDRG